MRSPWRSLPILGFLLLASLVPLAAAKELPKADWTIEDPAGDVYVYSDETTLQPPANAANAHMDLTGVQIDGEDEAGFYVTFLLSDFRHGGRFLCCPQAPDVLELDFELRGKPVQYAISLISYSSVDPLEPAGLTTSFSRAALCIRMPEGECFTQRLATVIDDEANTIRVHVSKAAVIGQGQQDFFISCWFFGCDGFDRQKRAPPGTPSRLGVGDVLHKFHATYHSSDEASPNWYDKAPNEGEAPEYRLVRPMANIEISVTSWEGHRQSVEIGETTPLDLGIINYAPGRRVIDLSVELDGAPDDVAKFQVKAPESVSVPGESARNVTFFVTTLGTTSPLNQVHLILRGQSTTVANELLYARILLVPTIGLGPENPGLFLHSSHYEIGLGPVSDPLCDTFGCSYAWMNTLKDDPTDDKVEVRGYAYMNGLGTFESQQFIYGFENAAVRPIAFDDARPVQLNLKMRSDVPVEGELKATLVTLNTGTLVATGSQRMSLSTTSTSTPIDLAVGTTWLVLPAEDTAFQLQLRFAFDTASSHSFVGFGPLGFRIVTSESSLNLPLVPPPEDFDRGTPGALVRLTPLGDRESYVNPGEARLFNVTLLNVGQEQDVAHLNVSIDRPGWTVDVIPGTDYRVGSGESVVFGLLVHAPANAAEGEAGIVRINATSDGAPDERAFLRFGVIATNGLDLPNDGTATFEIQEDAREKLLSGPKKGSAPGPGGILLLAALLGVAWGFGRRRA